MTTAPGWYDDAHGALRWWDGAQWTEHVQPLPAAAAPAPQEPAQDDASDLAAQFEDSPRSTDSAEPATPAGTPHEAEPIAPVASPPIAPPGIPPIPVAPGSMTGMPPYASFTGGPPVDMRSAPQDQPPAKAKSKMWIVWVVIGVVVLAVIGGAIAFAIAIFSQFSAPSNSGANGPEQDAAVAAVYLHDEAWQGADCVTFEEATTDSYRADAGFVDCDDFVEQAQYFLDTTSDYEVIVTDVEQDGGVIIVETTETYMTSVDGDGEPLESPEAISEDYQYTIVDDGGTWRIDEWD